MILNLLRELFKRLFYEKKTKKIKSPKNTATGCNQLATLEDWQEFAGE